MLKLQTFSENDFQQLIDSITSAEDLMQFAGPAFSFPLTNDQLQQSLADEKRIAFSVIEDNMWIGHAEIYNGDECAFLARILIAEGELRGNGLGKSIVQMLLEYAFEILDKPCVKLNVFDWNIAAIRCYEKAGMKITARNSAERKVNGHTWFLHTMGMDRTEWKTISEIQQ